MKLELERHTLRLARPLETSHGEVSERELVQVSLHAEGASAGGESAGWGEAAPLASYDGVGVGRVVQALERYVPVLASLGRDADGGQALAACREADALPQALAAIDMALWDRAGRIAGRPVAALLCDEPAARVPVNATLSASDRAGAAMQAAAAAQAGYGCVKVKVGLGDDAGRVAAVRAAAGPRMALRLDANGGWDVKQAVQAIGSLSPAGLELVEEPVHGIEAMRAVREHVAVRVSIDETAAEQGALSAEVADAVCLKVSRCGGISSLLAAASLVRASGAEIYLASTLDGPLGVAAALHAASALASRGPLPHCGLATLGLFADVEDPLPVRAGQIALPGAPGLGVEPV